MWGDERAEYEKDVDDEADTAVDLEKVSTMCAVDGVVLVTAAVIATATTTAAA